MGLPSLGSGTGSGPALLYWGSWGRVGQEQDWGYLWETQLFLFRQEGLSVSQLWAGLWLQEWENPGTLPVSGKGFGLSHMLDIVVELITKTIDIMSHYCHISLYWSFSLIFSGAWPKASHCYIVALQNAQQRLSTVVVMILRVLIVEGWVYDWNLLGRTAKYAQAASSLYWFWALSTVWQLLTQYLALPMLQSGQSAPLEKWIRNLEMLTRRVWVMFQHFKPPDIFTTLWCHTIRKFCTKSVVSYVLFWE